MASLKYRCLTPNPITTEYPVAASQVFYHEGAQFVYLDGSGNVTVGVTATATVIGWAIVPVGVGAWTTNKLCWKSSATAGADKIAVITDPNAEFLVGADDTVTAAYRGNACDLVLTTADGSGPQLVDIGTTSNDVVRITKIGTEVVGGSTTDCVVRINSFQADT